ncbi:polysaccharide biosynthesis tyrosine autokinase [Anabaena cylindrica FACHB-243]|uniref:Capsular exopolysaccharide family n=1 Tax=Anabaena cylindrica (strain ATCC 27899 / PCC 7122) TaxID=272123 RepID=K9ZKR1_ANACC|nr:MULTISPECIES: tyrosine-protein kinase domain-containing protein [Anabaena]AFZ58920.1 capsular exopolysaccharide family [Anabaena cylindrica PCC 7122]MBD2419503.1 polysaccharide biosynthesis tyrosine autokinase [Anabaena cylindrica FACHB-243]MBY5283970.1 polysaccharide biosynthesis tyrosine autokinase [Anabaena sp. CCAP 1446/1C]MBY5310796.1 polysaccharide biosynthesis tyrosine autokinase [Anabaena sp. CCAP 1446/1C]MCM2408314.1 polysaccharide biosynthesis tyrosine autokinase [Anabaena sp. CCA
MTPPIIKRYLIAFEKYKWVGLASFGLVVIGSTVVAIQPDPPVTYMAESALTYNTPTVSFSKTGSEIQAQGKELTPEVLLSDPVIETVAAKVKTNPKTIAKNVGIKFPSRNRAGELESTSITMKYVDSDANRAKDVLQELMKGIVQLSSEINTGRLKAIIQKINERLPEIKQELQAAENKLEEYDRRERTAILAAENGSLLNGISASQNQQRGIQLTISGIDAQLRSLEDKLGLTVGQAYVSSALSADPIIANLRSQIYQTESQIAVLRKDLRPEHPTMIQLTRQKEASEELLQQRAAEVLGGGGLAAPLRGNVTGIRTQSSLDPTRQALANQMVALQTQRETLEQQLKQQIQQEAQLRREYSLIPNKQLERSRLEQSVGLKKAIYDQMQAKLTDAQAAEAETVSSFTIARPPIATNVAVPTRSIPTTLAIGGFLGAVIGGGVIFLLGSLEGTFKTKEDIRESLKAREVLLLGELPLMPVDDLAPEALPVILSPDSPYLEFYEKFRSNLRRIGGNDVKVILITSVSSQEGKTVSAYNLGIASALAGKRTLIIETDLRSPSQAASLKIAPDSYATVEPLLYYSSLSDCIRLVPDVENLYIIPSVGPVRQSAAIIESSEMRRLIEDARERYDLVILDTNPLSISNDPLLIQPYSDGIVLVARPNYTQENMLGEAIDQLVEAELGLLGAIINSADIRVSIPEPVVEFSFPEPELELEVIEQSEDISTIFGKR